MPEAEAWRSVTIVSTSSTDMPIALTAGARDCQALGRFGRLRDLVIPCMTASIPIRRAFVQQVMRESLRSVVTEGLTRPPRGCIRSSHVDHQKVFVGARHVEPY